MTSPDDLPLESGAPGQRAAGSRRFVLPGAEGGRAGGAGRGRARRRHLVFTSRNRDTTTAPTSDAAPTASAPQAAADAPPVAVPLPPLEQMDPYVRELFRTLSTHPEMLKWLATDDLVASMATAIDKLAQGQSPARDLAVLKPKQGFALTRRDGTASTATSSYARYAPLVEAVAAVDPGQLAAVFTTLRPRLAEAYARQGHPGGGFDEAVRRAVQVIATTPDVPDGAALVPAKGGYAYADPAFERLPPAQKHLVRMGPEHVRRVREAARRFGEALAAVPAPR